MARNTRGYYGDAKIKTIVETPEGEVYTYKTKGGKVQARLSWNPAFGKKYSELLGTAQAKMDEAVMRYMEPYMPMQTGAMIKSMTLCTHPGTGEVIVNTPYARKVYYSKSAIGRPTGALRGPKYFERMKADKKDAIRRIAARAAGAK